MTQALRHSLPPFDEEGFLLDPALWDDELALYVAQSHGIADLTQTHWVVIRFLRAYHEKFGTIPAKHHVTHVNHLDKNAIDRLFPTGFRDACRIAGMPNPGEEAITYM